MNTITLNLDADTAREMMMALNERRFLLNAEMNATKNEEVYIIANRQHLRVTEAMQAIQSELGEVWV